MSAGSSIHAVFFCAFRHFAQRAFWYAAMRLRAAADVLRPLRASIATTFCPLTSQNRFCAARLMGRTNRVHFARPAKKSGCSRNVSDRKRRALRSSLSDYSSLTFFGTTGMSSLAH
jgi:hypothetical protein